ncbi:mannose-1-phosphate guanyltransferase [Helicobacter pylori PeCan18]|uniref:mannose-1-phosphate guanylyltransferase/mannose-6-phosphate isomerase n=1 Tax=Helicobacter pylori TaxID=210 RepID=UPI0002594914|nr:mannose-1-phosphate guanylyltransferase/mannose-6-phosphate isomerase [Helicobacter pylori]AFI01847.1 mannose-1-phosphate guanyltransferase [Helicobacter pylori PeCan18]
MKIKNVLLSGGSGKRLWPLSRSLYPKQFLKLFNHKSLFELSFKRNASLVDETLIVCNEKHYFLALEEIKNEIQNKSVGFLLESLSKNTANAISLSALMSDKEDLLIVTPSDHLIKDLQAYENAIKKAIGLAQKGFLVTFGIKIDKPNMEFGYIESPNALDVKRFIEKPSLEKAIEFQKSGGFYFNSGMFVFQAGVFLDELKKHAPTILKGCERAFESLENTHFFENKIARLSEKSMQDLEDVSVDIALMQQSHKIKMVELNAKWSDLGNFNALFEEAANGTKENVSLNQTPVFAKESENNLVFSHKVSALLGVEDLAIIDTKDALLIAHKDKAKDLKALVSEIETHNQELLQTHTKVYRPWGSYEVLHESGCYKVKILEVKPNARLSLQKHFHRSEHWVVISGMASVELDHQSFELQANQSTYIPKNTLHRLANYGKIPLIIIEVQVGEYVGEDDIVRVDDDFNRQNQNA